MEARRTILIVDDVPMFRELESVFVARCGRVITAESGEEALSLVESDLPDVVVLDWSLPDMDGESFCRRLKAQPEYAHIAVIAVTSAGDPDDHERAIRAGATDVLAKPLSRTALVGTVSRFTRDGPIRGLPRISLETRIHLVDDALGAEGRIRNLSRGGLFVATRHEFAVDRELGVHFRLPDSAQEVRSRVTVVWRSDGVNHSEPGFGARFLGLDRDLARHLDDYVHERGGRPDQILAPRTSPPGP